MLEYIRKLWKIAELRNKILYTFGMLLLFRLVGCIPAPGIDLTRLGMGGTDLPLLIDNIPESVYHAIGGYFPEGGEPFNKQNMLTVPELLTAWTKGGAYNLYCEDTLGTLEAGKKADIAVLSGNIFTVAVEDARSLNCELTLLGGKIVHNTL